MKAFFAKVARLLPYGPFSFAAKSTLVLATIVAAGRSFAGNTTSGVQPAVSSFTNKQLFVLKKIVEEKLQSDEINTVEKIELEKIKMDLTKSLSLEEENLD